MKKTSKILGVVLAVLMVAGMVPFSAFAATTGTTIKISVAVGQDNLIRSTASDSGVTGLVLTGAQFKVMSVDSI